jgi:hypothetical protein
MCYSATLQTQRLRRTVQRAAAGIAPNALEVAELAAHGEAVAEVRASTAMHSVN